MRAGPAVLSARFAGTPGVRSRLCSNAGRRVRRKKVSQPRTTPHAQWEPEDDVDVTPFSPIPTLSPALRDTVSAFYDRAVVRALADQFVPYENASGIINLAECATSDGWSPVHASADEPDLTKQELVDAAVAELGGLFGVSGVESCAALVLGRVAPGLGDIPSFGNKTGESDVRDRDFGDSVGDSGDSNIGDIGDSAARNGGFGDTTGGGFVWCKLSVFMGTDDWFGEAELHESLLETYGLLLVPGMLRGAHEPGWFLLCVAGRDEETLLTGVDRLRMQLTQRKFLHGRW